MVAGGGGQKAPIQKENAPKRGGGIYPAFGGRAKRGRLGRWRFRGGAGWERFAASRNGRRARRFRAGHARSGGWARRERLAPGPLGRRAGRWRWPHRRSGGWAKRRRGSREAFCGRRKRGRAGRGETLRLPGPGRVCILTVSRRAGVPAGSGGDENQTKRRRG
jgi:hypothetical protein